MSIFIVLGAYLWLYSKTSYGVYQHKPEFSGTVIEINNDTSILVKVDDNNSIIKNNDLILVPLNVKFPEASISSRDLDIGVKVRVYYNETIEKGSSTQINKVYIIFLNKI